MIKVNFTKMAGSGNDFIIIDNRREQIPEESIAILAQKACDRIDGIGGDGLILIEISDKADFKMRIINRDGSEAEMCGNGARCAVCFAYKKNIAQKHMKFETIAGIIGGVIDTSNYVKVKMTDPHSILEIKKDMYKIDTGVPHVVLFVDDIKNVNVKKLGASIRYDDFFKPKGANVNFVQIKNEHEIFVRTYERGVENETLSCGSGSTASAIISAMIKGCSSPVRVHTKSEETLIIYFDIKRNEVKNVYLEGKVEFLFESEFDLVY